MTAMITAAVIGVGGAAYSVHQAGKQQDKALAANQEAIDQAQSEYDDWQQVYGPIQQNLADYYGSLSPEYYETVGLEAFQQEQQTALAQIDQSLAQRGIDPSSGIAASLEAQATLSGAEQKAAIRRDAPRLAAEDKTNFLQVGLGQDPSGDLLQTKSNQASMQQTLATQANQVAGQAVSSAVSGVGSALADYADPQPTTDYSTVGGQSPSSVVPYNPVTGQ